MKIIERKTFVWYADDPKDGELVLVIPVQNACRDAYIYCPRMIFERLGKGRINQLQALELSFGPIGSIPRKYYEEAGFMTRTPFLIRLIALTDCYGRLTDEDLEKNDDLICSFILSEWKKVYENH